MKLKKCINYESKIIYWDNTEELLREAKKVYKKGMKIAKQVSDLELKDKCEKIAQRYTVIQNYKLKKDNLNDKEMEFLLVSIIILFGNITICKHFINSYESN